jgi:O-antigen chain-terminating methyltransferase
LSEQPLEDLLARLERERQAADRLYNDALTAVDRAIQSIPTLPDPPGPIDRSRLTQLSGAWNLLPSGPPPIDRSLKGRLRGLVWRTIGPPIQAQTQFNSTLVDHLHRTAEGQQQVADAVASLGRAIERELQALVRFQSLLVQYLQTITVYVDSKDRSLGGRELRERLALTEQRMLALKRDVERALEGRALATTATTTAPTAAATSGGAEAFAASVDSVAYVAFEDRFRGSKTEIAARVDEYLPVLESVSDVVDVGCGRGELLALLRARGVGARGVDANQAMVDVCRSQGLDVDHGDALAYLERQRDGSVGGLVAIQVVEHFEPGYLTRFLQTAYHKMTPGAPLILETINAACWMAFFECYIRDLTHQRPLHPETLRYLVQASGFSAADVRLRRPVTEEDRLDHVTGPWTGAGAESVARVAAALNAHAEKLNARLFSSMDYAVVARR